MSRKSRTARVVFKSQDDLKLMRISGQLLASVFAYLDKQIKEGLTTLEVNNLAEAHIVGVLQSRPASKGQYGFEYVLNTSINQVVCHGVPSKNEVLKNGDIVNVDITLEKNGFIADSSKMYCLGDVSKKALRLVKTTYEALWKGIGVVKPGATLGDVGFAIQQYAENAGYSVVREYCGHGIGRQMHEEPSVCHYGLSGHGMVLQKGMTFTIEPMINQGAYNVKELNDGWTVVTKDGMLSAQWEHTIAVTDEGYEVLTLRDEERLRGFC